MAPQNRWPAHTWIDIAKATCGKGTGQGGLCSVLCLLLVFQKAEDHGGPVFVDTLPASETVSGTWLETVARTCSFSSQFSESPGVGQEMQGAPNQCLDLPYFYGELTHRLPSPSNGPSAHRDTSARPSTVTSSSSGSGGRRRSDSATQSTTPGGSGTPAPGRRPGLRAPGWTPLPLRRPRPRPRAAGWVATVPRGPSAQGPCWHPTMS